ncbi:hypothetical protein cyc_06474 [Cyclospora cayetanensis]|uniref:Uncharacterized protein n=1 Tax=Cyclospora cayetanensis TaxID=88456 RepID=A0A1D3D3G3_9EIME|nr:hypothetical protein cyc_06474 [Cyclospora cayetanensis]
MCACSPAPTGRVLSLASPAAPAAAAGVHAQMGKPPEKPTAMAAVAPSDKPHMLQVRACTEREFQQSYMAITAVDAIMDEGVFEHLKKFSSYNQRQIHEIPATFPLLTFGERREGSGVVAARVTELLQLPGEEGFTGASLEGGHASVSQGGEGESDGRVHPHPLLPEHEQQLLESGSSHSARRLEQASADSILVAALCELLATKYNSHVSRKLLQDKSQHGSWRPPPFYWHLFDHPCIVRQMLQLYHQRPQDEFLACWFEDFALHRRQSSPSSFPASDADAVLTAKVLTPEAQGEEVSEGESILEPLCDYLTEGGVRSECVASVDCGAIAETGRRVNQNCALCAWREEGAAATDTPAPFVERQREVSAAQLYLLLTNLDEFPRLASLFRSITRSLFIGVDMHLAPSDVCDLCDVVQQLLQRFESMQQLLGAPVEPPLTALRETALLDSLLDDFEQQAEHEPWQFDGDPEEMQRSSDEISPRLSSSSAFRWKTSSRNPSTTCQASEEKAAVPNAAIAAEATIAEAAIREAVAAQAARAAEATIAAEAAIPAIAEAAMQKRQ